MSYTRLFLGLLIFTIVYILLKHDLLKEVSPLPVLTPRRLEKQNNFVGEINAARIYDKEQNTDASVTTTIVLDKDVLAESRNVDVNVEGHGALSTSNHEKDEGQGGVNNRVIVSQKVNEQRDEVQNSAQQSLIHKLENDNSYLDDDDDDSINENNDKQLEDEINKLANYHLALEKLEEMRQTGKLFYNRVPKCGSTTIQQHTKQLRPYNNFTVSISHIYHTTAIDYDGFNTLMSEISDLPEPWFFTRHIHFVDFRKHDQDMPAYINLVRDPVDRFQSRYYFKTYAKDVQYRNINDCVELRDRRCTELSYDNETFILIPFFCGQHLYCMTPSQRALNQAKVNIIKHYTVVGILEEIRGFLQVLEYIFPQYYKHADKLYHDEMKNRSGKPATITAENRQKMQEVLGIEFELFSFIKARFYNLASQINAMDSRANITLKHDE